MFNAWNGDLKLFVILRLTFPPVFRHFRECKHLFKLIPADPCLRLLKSDCLSIIGPRWFWRGSFSYPVILCVRRG